MIRDIGLSSMNINFSESDKSFFDVFTSHHQINVKSLHIDWNDAWSELVRFGLNSHGPDVSEIGTTWLGGLHAMDALHPLTPTEATHLGSVESFHPAIWQACHVGQNNLAMAVPFILDMRMVLYRRDWLQKAGVNETTAFIDSAHFADTLRSIQAAGHPSPFGMPTSRSITRMIHDLAGWVWSAGGEIRSNDGRQMLLMEPKSRAGMQSYFSLNEFISPEMQALAEHELIDAFYTGKCAVAILPERAYLGVLTNQPNVNAEVAENVGMAMLMKTPFVGGTALAVWLHSPNYQDGLKLIQYLTSMEAWQILNQQSLPYAPARLSTLAQSPFAATPFYPAIEKTLQNGRSFQTGYRWSGVESRLVAVVENLWNDLRANPTLDITHEVEKRFLAVCNHLERTILVSSS